MIQFDRNGKLTIEASKREELENLMHLAFATPDMEQMKALASQEVALMVNTVADYIEYGSWLLTPREIGVNDDIKLIKKRYDVQAFQTSVDGRALITRAGYLTDYFSYVDIDCGFEVLWADLASAPFDVLASKIQEAGEAMAKKRDALLIATVDAAVSGLSGHEPTVADYLTKASIDSVVKTAAALGTSIKRAVVNAGTILDMATSNFGTWPFPNLPESRVEELVTKGWFAYGGIDWKISHTAPATKVYFTGDPANTGLTVRKGPLGAASDINIYNRTNVYTYWETRGNEVFNPYNVWQLTLT